MAGTIGNVIVSWTVDTPDGPRSAAIDVETLRRHCRPERVGELLDDLAVMLEDVQDAHDVVGRQNSTVLRVLR
jgi:hypothetical protein